MGYKTLTFRIDEKIADELKEKAFFEKTSQSELVRKYIQNGLDSDKNQQKLNVE